MRSANVAYIHAEPHGIVGQGLAPAAYTNRKEINHETFYQYSRYNKQGIL